MYTCTCHKTYPRLFNTFFQIYNFSNQRNETETGILGFEFAVLQVILTKLGLRTNLTCTIVLVGQMVKIKSRKLAVMGGATYFDAYLSSTGASVH